MKKILQIGPSKIKVEAGSDLRKLEKFLEQFVDSPGKKFDGKLIIKIGDRRQILLNKSKKILKIIGPDLNSVRNQKVIIMILQVLFRFSNFLSFVNGKKPHLLLHGSAAMWDDKKSIFFGDDGKNIGKTTAATLLAVKTKKFVVDEFGFYDVENNCILGWDFLPIHARANTSKLLNRKCRSNLGYVDDCLISPKELGFRVAKKNNLSMIIYPAYKLSGSSRIRRLSGKKAEKNLAVLSASHLLKLFYPKFDRASWLKQEDSAKVYSISKKCSVLALPLKPYLSQILQKVPSYELIYTKSSQIYPLIKLAVDKEMKRIVEHRSASAVVYFKKDGKIKFLFLKKKNGNLVLPKGHIEKGEASESTALREAKEEAGLKRGKVIRFLSSDSYFFKPDYGFATHRKKVLTYLIKGEILEPCALEHEGFVGVELLSADDVARGATFESERRAVQKSLKFIK